MSLRIDVEALGELREIMEDDFGVLLDQYISVSQDLIVEMDADLLRDDKNKPKRAVRMTVSMRSSAESRKNTKAPLRIWRYFAISRDLAKILLLTAVYRT